MPIPSLDSPPARYPLRQDNHLAIWVDGLPFYERLLDCLAHAQERIWAAISFLQPDLRFAAAARTRPGGARGSRCGGISTRSILRATRWAI